MLLTYLVNHLLHPTVIPGADNLLSEKLFIEIIEPDTLRYIPFWI